MIDRMVLDRRGVFVAGTDTGVGKTVVSAALARSLAQAGLRIGAMKVVQTGIADGADDLAFVASFGRVLSGFTACPYRLASPLAPAVAARMEGTSIDIEVILRAFAGLTERAEAVVVEGAGGLLVPVTDEVTMADLAGELGLPCVVVARPSLGTLSHTALTIEAARSRGLDILGVVFSAFPDDPGASEVTNPAEIERLCGTRVVGAVPFLDGLDVDAGELPRGAEPTDWLAPGLGGRFDREAFLADMDQRRHVVAPT